MKTSMISALLAPLLMMSAESCTAADTFALKPNDTVVFYGDSITDQRMYSMLTEFFVVTRYPKLNVTFVHSGWGGDRVTGGGGGPIDIRLARDVFAYHPTVMTIMLGMNDGNYANHKDADDQTYFTGYRHIIESVQKSLPNVRITVIGPSPFDDVTRPLTLQPGGYNSVLIHYSDYLKKYAQDAKLGYADLNTGVVQMLQKANATDPAIAQKIIPDRVHPAWAGHLIMAEQLLKAWDARPLVSSVSIDASGGKVVDSEYAKVSEMRSGAALSWAETEEALPLPLADLIAADREKTMDLAVKSSDVTEALNQEPLKITGLATGRYKLAIDNEPIGIFSEAELAHGVNLAMLQTPMSRQAMQVRDLTQKRLDVHQQRWRTLQVPMMSLDLLHLKEAIASLDELDAELEKRQHEAAQPLPHVFQVSPVQ